MSEFLKMDIFFVVATAAVILLAVMTAWVLWRLERVLRNVERISNEVAIESEFIRQDIDEMRGDIRRGKGRIKSLFKFFNKTSARGSKDS